MHSSHPSEHPGHPSGSRRRRLWDLPRQTHCPVIGVCLPLPTLRRLVDKTMGGRVELDEYELHAGAVTDCAQRNAMSEAFQRELDRRYAIALRNSACAKTGEELYAWWTSALQGTDTAGALWATLTHARCDAAIEERVCRDIHMLQHQVGACNRADLQRLDEVLEENAVLTRALAAAQERCTRVLSEKASHIERLQAGAVQMRAELIARDTQIADLREQLQALEEAVPGLPRRAALVQQIDAQARRLRELERSLIQAREQARRLQEAASLAEIPPVPHVVEDAPAANITELQHRAVLCVGGRPASVPVYRQLIERTGGRFLHHDGGEENNVAQLDASLAAADLVICQTGCISHDAYWRVKDHCRRTGKRCVFVENPSGSSLQRALGHVVVEGVAPRS